MGCRARLDCKRPARNFLMHVYPGPAWKLPWGVSTMDKKGTTGPAGNDTGRPQKRATNRRNRSDGIWRCDETGVSPGDMEPSGSSPDPDTLHSPDKYQVPDLLFFHFLPHCSGSTASSTRREASGNHP